MSPVKTVSIVDDDESVRNAISSLVRSMGMESRVFSSANEFIDSGLEAESDCLITDIQMPGLSGTDLQQQLLAQGSKLPIIVVTAYPDIAIRQHVLSNGAVCFLAKPFDASALIACIETALKSSHP